MRQALAARGSLSRLFYEARRAAKGLEGVEERSRVVDDEADVCNPRLFSTRHRLEGMKRAHEDHVRAAMARSFEPALMWIVQAGNHEERPAGHLATP